jgi:hypothetical protein
MKVRRQLEAMEELVLNRLGDLTGDDWYRAPDGEWSVAQIISHLAVGMDMVARAFEERADASGMERRATPEQALLRHMLLGNGEFPERAEAPEMTVPDARPNPEMVVAQFRMAAERMGAMVTEWPEERQLEVFVRHPYVGDLNLPEWVRFHYVHCRHHAKQLEERLAWLGL